MIGFVTPADIARRTAAAVEAAVAASHGFGLTVTDPMVLHDLFSVVVHLAPSPVVARIPVVVPHNADLASQARRQQAELDVTRWLADQGVSVITPSSLVSLEPVQRGGFSMTFWQFVDEDRDKEADYIGNCEAVADLHLAMRRYPGRLSFLSAVEPAFISESLALLEEHPELIDPADLNRARREWQTLDPVVRSQTAFQKAFGGVDLQPIHGDSPPANIFSGVNGGLFSDFEMVTLGPIEWDLAGLGPVLESAYNRGAQRNGMRPLDEDVLAFVNAVGALRTIAYLTLVPQLPVLSEYLNPPLEQWRAMPFAGGIAGRIRPGDER